MKSFLKAVGIIAFIAVIGFTMIGCKEDDGGSAATEWDGTYVGLLEEDNGRYATFTLSRGILSYTNANLWWDDHQSGSFPGTLTTRQGGTFDGSSGKGKWVYIGQSGRSQNGGFILQFDTLFDLSNLNPTLSPKTCSYLLVISEGEDPMTDGIFTLLSEFTFKPNKPVLNEDTDCLFVGSR